MTSVIELIRAPNYPFTRPSPQLSSFACDSPCLELFWVSSSPPCSDPTTSPSEPPTLPSPSNAVPPPSDPTTRWNTTDSTWDPVEETMPVDLRSVAWRLSKKREMEIEVSLWQWETPQSSAMYEDMRCLKTHGSVNCVMTLASSAMASAICATHIDQRAGFQMALYVPIEV